MTPSSGEPSLYAQHIPHARTHRMLTPAGGCRYGKAEAITPHQHSSTRIITKKAEGVWALRPNPSLPRLAEAREPGGGFPSKLGATRAAPRRR
eukprot:CAMPEP_0118877596 /NCGR_PEP_ID=MMETSP1163-20130328/17837_1 /TAXON_ID=124430 /ORGANISM="Phaeomonas parva, Strain CCMP2877" /LENGTH=92 /DNA_ID=CAMNT_0006813325 /DNA_START=24 /DNA_END=303 /DNA_ORIENTATION=-